MKTILFLLLALPLALPAQVPQLKIPVGHPGGIGYVDAAAMNL
jgi:hypothetical protein